MSYRRFERTRPIPARTELSVGDRLQWAREQWRKNPDLSVNGPRGMYARMMEVFGVAAKTEQLAQVRAEVRREVSTQEELIPMSKPPVKISKPVLTPEQAKVFVPSSTVPASDSPTAPEPVAPGPAAPVDLEPGQGSSRLDIQVRRRYAEQVATKDMSAAQVAARVKERYGVGLDTVFICELLARLRGRERRSDWSGRRSSSIPLTPREEAPERPARPERPSAAQRGEEAEIEAAVAMLLEACPGLVELHVLRGEDGQPEVNFRIETVRAGSLRIKKEG